MASDLLFAHVILRSVTGKSVKAAGREITVRNVVEYLPDQNTQEEAKRLLTELGFTINLVARSHITITAHKELFETTFRVHLNQKLAPYLKAAKGHLAAPAKQSYYEADPPPEIPANLEAVVEAVEFPGPVTYLAAAAPPQLGYFHLAVPDDIAHQMDAYGLGIRGTGIKLAMVDTGFSRPLHAYYIGKGYNIQPVVSDPLDPNPDDDDTGHGTAMAACALAVAPDVTFTMYKVYSSNAANPNHVDAFSRAVQAGSNIITCSWGTIYITALRTAVIDAVANGIVVCFSCGNGGDVSWPGTEPDVISVGGAVRDYAGHLQASNFASSGINPTNPGRQAPDLCGICGMAPSGVLITLPTQRGSYYDDFFSSERDGTKPDDGWCVMSGTSSAAPMVAATAALIMEADGGTVGRPDIVKPMLIASCMDVTDGQSASGEAAGPNEDPATGAGLVQATRAVRLARGDLTLETHAM